jgi:hypothetical protein
VDVEDTKVGLCLGALHWIDVKDSTHSALDPS